MFRTILLAMVDAIVARQISRSRRSTEKVRLQQFPTSVPLAFIPLRGGTVPTIGRLAGTPLAMQNCRCRGSLAQGIDISVVGFYVA